MIIRSISGLGFAMLLTCAGLCGACSQTPAKAPGSNPEDMSAAAHREDALVEEQLAAEHERQKENVGPSKPNMEENQRALQEKQVRQHLDYARQHNEAADIVEGSK
jgi:hypothetical protein